MCEYTPCASCRPRGSSRPALPADLKHSAGVRLRRQRVEAVTPRPRRRRPRATPGADVARHEPPLPAQAALPARCRFGGCGSSRAGGGRASFSSPLSFWGLWQFSRFARCVDGGCCRDRAAITPNPATCREEPAVGAPPRLPQPPNWQRAGRGNCHNPNPRNAPGRRIAITPIRATRRGAENCHNPENRNAPGGREAPAAD